MGSLLAGIGGGSALAGAATVASLAKQNQSGGGGGSAGLDSGILDYFGGGNNQSGRRPLYAPSAATAAYTAELQNRLRAYGTGPTEQSETPYY